MSSLRRRAICVQRARSIARSSIGGRASARTTAPASPGSTSSRSQASRSRTSARWKNAAAPDEPVGHGALLQRRGDRLALALDRAHEHADVLRARRPSRDDEPLDVGGDRLRLRALVRAAPERDLARRRPSGASQPLLDPSRIGRHHRARPRRGSGSPERKALGQPHDARLRPLGAEVGDVLRRRAAEAVIAWSSSAATRDVAVVGDEQPQQQVLGEVRVLELVDEDVRGSAPRAARGRAACSRSSRNAWRTRSPKSSVPASASMPVVRGVDRGELALAHRARPRRSRRPPAAWPPRRRSRAAVTSSSLSRSIRWHDRAEQRARVAAQVVRGERQLVDPLEQQRQPVGRRHRRGERVDARLERLLAQQPRAEAWNVVTDSSS